MAGDGESINDNPQPGEYNDPGGMTYGRAWLMRHFEEVWTALKGSRGEADLTPWVIPMPGYDGVVPAWQPFTGVNDYVKMARRVVGPDHGLAIELSAGYCVWTGEGNDWAMEDGMRFDTILQEFHAAMGPPDPIPAAFLEANGNWKPDPAVRNEDRAPFDQVWQMVGRMVSPYHRPPDQPQNDDGGGAPFHLRGGTPRGPFFYVAWEFDTYRWVRGQVSAMEVNRHRAYLRSLGCKLVG
jgi:hypothetical protein